MIGNDWDEKLSIIWHSPGFKKFMNIVEREYNTKIIYPPKNYIFNALKLTPYHNVKVVIVDKIHIMVKVKLMDYPFLFKKALNYHHH